MARKCLSYLRVSGASQVKGDGFPRQREAIAKFCKANDLILVDEFVDEGVSGTNELEDREGLSALLQRIATNGVRVVVVENASRLARDLLIAETILAGFRKLGVTVLASDGVDLTVADGNPTQILIRQILGAVAEFEKSVLVSKLKTARKRIRNSGERCDGAKPFGELEGEAETLDRIRELRRKPRGGNRPTFAVVADTLNREKRATRHGGDWTKGSVHAICKRLGMR